MRPRSPLPVAFALLIALATVAALPVADARAPPTPVCGVCDLDTTVDGTSVVAGESSLSITVHGNGSTTWEATVDLAVGGDALAANDSLRRAVVAATVDDGIADAEAVGSSVDGDTLRVRYRDTGATAQQFGAVVFTPLTPEGPDRLFAIGGEGSRYLASDRLTIGAGSGNEIHGDADTVESGSLVWTREPGTEQRSLDVAADPVVVDAEAGAIGVRTWLARLLT